MKQRTRRTHALWESLLSTFRHHPFLSLGLFLLILLSAGVSLLPPYILEAIVNQLDAGGDFSWGLAGLYVGVQILTCLMMAGREACISIFGQKMTHSLRTRMSKKLSKLDSSYFVGHTQGETASRFLNDVDVIEELFADGVISMASDVVTIIGAMIMIAFESLGLFFIMLALIPLVFAFVRFAQKRMLKAQLENRKAVSQSSSILPETLSSIRSIHVNDGEEHMKKKYSKSIDRGYAAMNKTAFYDSIFSPVVIVLSALLIGVTMILCVSFPEAQAWFGITTGGSVGLIGFVNRVFEPLESLGMEIQNIQQARAGLNRVNAFLAEAERVDSSSQKAEGKPIVSVEHLDFSYEDGVPILKDFSLEAQQGDQITIRGRTGAGKSTLFKCLLGLYKPQGGHVYIGGYEASSLPPSERRTLLSCVEQNFSLVPGSIAEQITLHDASISDEAVRKALKTVGLWDKVSAFPKQEQTPCTTSLFSQGEFQLLSIARAIVSDPQILLLDEITANLDTITEDRILNALEKASVGRTTISISHRQRQSERVVMLKGN